MSIFNTMADKIRDGIRTWLHVQPAQRGIIDIQEIFDFEGNAIKNQIWYRGVSEELSQLYDQIDGDKTRFWAAKCSPGLAIRKIHVGLPAMLVDMLASIVVADMNEVDVGSRQSDWDKIAEENDFAELVKQAITDTLIVGDGAFKLSIDTNLSQYPIIEFYPGDRVEIIRERGRVKEVVFKTVYTVKNQEYILLETYGKGYITYMLTRDNKECDISTVPELAGLRPVTWENKSFMMAIPLMFYKSAKFRGRGKSIYDSKIDEFDALDEAWSQWMDALRSGRSKEYIPDNLLPRDPNTGAILKPNAFDNRYIQTEADMREGTQNKITLDQPAIPHDSYLATYCTALDLALQGLISPSTIGIDVKKLDNAEAQREKEKTTLYTRNAIVEALTEDLRELVISCLNSYREINSQKITEIKPSVTFGEYANPSFESQVETVSKGKTGGIMSIEACVEELYGDSQDEEWKEKEVARLKNEQGIMQLEEPSVNLEAEEFNVQGFGGQLNAGEGSKQNVQHEPEGISGAPAGGA